MAGEKTSVMRILNQKRVPYTPHHCAYPNGVVDGASVAALLGRDSAPMHKTLVTQGASRQYYVFVIPVLCSLNLKAAARAVGEKSIEMIPQAGLLPLTDYVHGDCSPAGAEKPFPAVLNGSVEGLDAIVVSTGKIGVQMELTPAALCALVGRISVPVSK